jgi:hypothetical protein
MSDDKEKIKNSVLPPAIQEYYNHKLLHKEKLIIKDDLTFTWVCEICGKEVKLEDDEYDEEDE